MGRAEALRALIETMRSWERDPHGYRIKLGEVDHYISQASDALEEYAAALDASPKLPAPDLTKMLRARCGACGHRWVLAHLPIDAAMVGRFAKAPCPACGGRKNFMDTSRAVPTILAPYVAEPVAEQAQGSGQ